MKAMLRTVNDHDVTYEVLMFVCPGCVDGGPEGYDGVHMLPVNSGEIGKPSWDWNGDLEEPTLSPSILTTGYCRCHSFLKEGKFEYLTDSDHSLSGQRGVPLPELPEWVEKLADDKGEEDVG